MVSIIPLQLAQRRLDAGTVVQYSNGSPIGAAMQGFGDELSAVAERYQKMREQQEAFDAELARRRFNGQIAQAEDEVTATAPADGSGLHEAMYGQVDPRSGRVVKTGLFDTLFDAALPHMPESQRANFARQKEALRRVGGLRMAQRQLQWRQDYEQAQVDTVLQTNAIAIGKASPDDIVTFEVARQDGLDLIDKMGLDPGIRQQKVKDWFSAVAKARFEALIARDPGRALEMFGVGTSGKSSGSEASGVQPVTWIRVSGSSDADAAKGDRVGKLTPDERVTQSFGDIAPAPDPMAIKPATDRLADLSPDDVQRLINQAHAANTAQLIEARTNIALAAQNAADAIANTGSYSGKMPSPADFAAVYGTEEGGKQYRDLARKIDVGRQAFGMRTLPNQAIHATLRDAEPGPGSSEEEQIRYQVTAAAALKTLGMRRADPGGYVRETFASLDAAWNNPSKPEDYQAAIIGSIAAQQQLGFETEKPLPNSVAGDVVDGLKNVTQRQDQEQTLSSIFAALPTRAAREAMLGHLLQTSAAQTEKSIADRTRREAIVDPKMLLDVRKAVELGLSDANVEVTNYIPTIQDQIGGFVVGDSKPNSVRRNLARTLVGSEGAGEQGFSLADITPLGALFAAEKVGTSARYGNYGDVVLNAAGVLPVDRMASAGLKQVGKIAEPLVKELSHVLKRSDELAEGAEALVRGDKLDESAEEVLSEGADRYKGVDDLTGSELAAEDGVAGATRRPTGQFYSVVFETRLSPELYPGVSRPRHFQAANEALLVLMERESDFAKILQEAGINLQRTRRGLVPRRAPRGYTWHHAEEPGVMQLVPISQHDPGTIFQKSLHPNRRGGFSLWGK